MLQGDDADQRLALLFWRDRASLDANLAAQDREVDRERAGSGDNVSSVTVYDVLASA